MLLIVLENLLKIGVQKPDDTQFSFKRILAGLSYFQSDCRRKIKIW